MPRRQHVDDAIRIKIIIPMCQVGFVTAPTDVPSAPGTVQITIPYADNTVAWSELNSPHKMIHHTVGQFALGCGVCYDTGDNISTEAGAHSILESTRYSLKKGVP